MAILEVCFIEKSLYFIEIIEIFQIHVIPHRLTHYTFEEKKIMLCMKEKKIDRKNFQWSKIMIWLLKDNFWNLINK